jgi:single-stranded DNA-binding protein
VSLYALATRPLIGDPQRRQGAKGPFTTATIRANKDEAVFVSIVAFDDEAERLLEFERGDVVAVSGRARLTSWTGRDGAEKHGISLVAEQIAATKPRSRTAMPRHRNPYSAARSTRGAGSPLPSDPVDDIYAEASA